MTTEQQEETGPVTVQIGVCSVCHALFLMSGDRLTSPCHGADPLVVLATLTIHPDAQVTGGWGLGADALAPDITEEPAPAVEEEPPAPAEEAPEDLAAAVPSPILDLHKAIAGFMEGTVEFPEYVKGRFLEAGAEPEDASTAVGRLEAVRELLQALEPPREAAPVALVPPEAEKSPEVS